MRHWKYYCPLPLNICVWQALQTLKSYNQVTKAITATAWLRCNLPGIKPRFQKVSNFKKSRFNSTDTSLLICTIFFNITSVISIHACFILHPIFISDSGVARQNHFPKLGRGRKKLSEWQWSGRPPSASKISFFSLIPCCTAFTVWHSLTLSINSPFLWVLTPMVARGRWHWQDGTNSY